MKCPYCGGKSRITDSRERKSFRWRGHLCMSCGKRFSTHEIYSKKYTEELKAYIKGVKHE